MNTALPKIEPLRWLIGMRAISDYVGFSDPKLRRLAIKQGFPIWRGTARVPGAIAWMTTVQDVEAWFGDQKRAAWEYLSATGTGRNLVATREPRPRRQSRYLTKAANDRLMPTTNV